MVLFAASAVLGVSIHSYCPPVKTGEFATDALTRNVSDRDEPIRTPAALTIMWSTCECDRQKPHQVLVPTKSLYRVTSCLVSKRINRTAAVVCVQYISDILLLYYMPIILLLFHYLWCVPTCVCVFFSWNVPLLWFIALHFEHLILFLPTIQHCFPTLLRYYSTLYFVFIITEALSSCI